ncbi:MAG: group II intron reverse transcriptase/maturase [Candidatus Pacebacteria bacterium]|nr:group II intron reverse transcriptase/maturase [Candidatus Paceibacterota bacterium]
MIDYYETKSQPITRLQVWEAYWKVRKNKGGMGIDGMSWKELNANRDKQLYKLWNRLTSGSYFPPPVKEVEIDKKTGGKRKLGIPTILDRIAQEIVRSHLDKIMEPKFHEHSYGYRKGRNQHQAVQKATSQALQYKWAIDIDIKGYFDTIDHKLLLKAVQHYCKDKWVLMYIKRWLRAGIIQKDGTATDRILGTPQGGVISPLLSNIFLHVVFDKWMDKRHPEKPFERFADDIVVHCCSEKQALFVKSVIQKRMSDCKLTMHPSKTQVVNFRGESKNRYPRKLDFLGFSIKLQMVKTKVGLKLMTTNVISSKSISSVLNKFREMKVHKMRGSIVQVSKRLSPVIRGIINYYCKFWNSHTFGIWKRLNDRLIKWVKWEKKKSVRAAIWWLKEVYRKKPGLFPHWKLVHP